MTWKKNDRGDYERPCRACGGRGVEGLAPGRSGCDCPWGENCEDVDHPANTRPDEHGWMPGIACKLVRCDRCRSVWLVYYETCDDSWDVPAPERLGYEIPPGDWRPDQ